MSRAIISTLNVQFSELENGSYSYLNYYICDIQKGKKKNLKKVKKKFHIIILIITHLTTSRNQKSLRFSEKFSRVVKLKKKEYT